MSDDPIFERTRRLIGAPALAHLQSGHALVFGVGGVGSWAAEALVRSGLGAVTLVDNDRVCPTNVNRQLQATTKNVGRPKVAELAARLRDLNPQCDIKEVQLAYTSETASDFDLDAADYVLDCIDTISCKIDLIRNAASSRAVFFASMGAASRLDPALVRACSIWETRGCRLARVIRRRLRTAGFVGDFQVVFSPEAVPATANGSPGVAADDPEPRVRRVGTRTINGSVVHMTALFGMRLAGMVVQDAVARFPVPGGGEAQPTTRTDSLQADER